MKAGGLQEFKPRLQRTLGTGFTPFRSYMTNPEGVASGIQGSSNPSLNGESP